MALKKKKVFGLEWCFEPFSDDIDFFSKRMFGGLSAYMADRLVLMLAEDPGNKSYRDKTYDFEIWNGILIPTSREHHKHLQEKYPALVPHPVLGKWLYLPMGTENFEGIASEIGERIAKRDPTIGVVSERSRKKTKSKRVKKKTNKKSAAKKTRKRESS